MVIKTPKYRKIISTTIIIFTVILLFEIFPNYYNLTDKFISITIQKISGNNKEQLFNRLTYLKEEKTKLEKIYYNEFSTLEKNNNFSEYLNKFTVNDNLFDISINSIRPLKKIKKDRLSFQRISLELNSNYENFYNYCRWLEFKGSLIFFEEINISKQQDNSYLKINLLIDIFYSGIEK